MDDYVGTERLSNGHLLVEHGLENSAVISFLRSSSRFAVLGRAEQNRLLGISYNHMVDWHIFPDPEGATFVYNRTEPLFVRRVSLAEDIDSWRADAFDRITGRKPNPNIKPLDDSLIDTISFWKRSLALELSEELPNEAIATLFNALIFVRALEDHRAQTTRVRKKALLQHWLTLRMKEDAKPATILDLLIHSLTELEVAPFPTGLLQKERLKVFDALDPETVTRLLRDFYENKYAPLYEYDFSIMSKHALSRIYEHYVSVLRRPNSPQLKLFADLPEEESNKATGTVYTPQFVARFFARYVKENLTPKLFRLMSVCDPACGSGIFLRTMLEMQCDPLYEMDPSGVAELAFQKSNGVDVDPNACEASKLSLSLLYLVVTGRLPGALSITNAEIIEHFSKHKELEQAFDVVVGNPPFIRWDVMTTTMKKRVATFMKGCASGKIDMFLPMLKVGMDMLKPDGLLLFVLPHSFLIARSAKELRKRIVNDCWVRFVGDVSIVPVFGQTGIYVILLILQRKNPSVLSSIPTIALQCRDFVGQALQDVVEGKVTESEYYSIFETPQEKLSPDGWVLTKPEESRLNSKISKFARLDHFLEIQEGFVSGADAIFIRTLSDVDKTERNIYVPFLADREMQRFQVPAKTASVVFHPFADGKKLTEDEVRKNYPETWKYLRKHIERLRDRGSVRSGQVEWWSPHRPVPVERMRRPKLVSPHLVLIPRFSFDSSGKYAISRSPWLATRDDAPGDEILLFFLGILNSTVAYWQLGQTSHKYSRGYVMLEKKTLKGLLVPDPNRVDASILKPFLRKVTRRMVETDTKVQISMEKEIDQIVADFYELSAEDRAQVGMEPSV